MLDDLCRQHRHPDAGTLGRPAQQIKRRYWPAPLPGHHDALSLLDHRYTPRPGLPPGGRRLARYLPLRPAPVDLVMGRPRVSLGLCIPSHESFRLQPHGLQAVGVHPPAVTKP